jgi:hypothetical protein
MRAIYSAALDGESSEQMPRLFVPGPVFAGFLAAAYGVFTVSRNIDRRNVSPVLSEQLTELIRSVVQFNPALKLAFPAR